MARILIIDDDPQSREMLRFRLGKSGHEVQESADGEDGLKRVRNDLPDLVLLDVRIPKLNGWDVCKALKSDLKTKSIPVVMLTGCSQDIQEQYGRQLGADEYITKPWEPTVLKKVIDRLLSTVQQASTIDTEALRQRTEQFALRAIELVNKLPKTDTAQALGQSLLRCATSVGASYRACCRAESPAAFIQRMAETEKYTDEAAYYLDLILKTALLEDATLSPLLAEAKDLTAVFAATGRSSRRDGKHNTP